MSGHSQSRDPLLLPGNTVRVPFASVLPPPHCCIFADRPTPTPKIRDRARGDMPAQIVHKLMNPYPSTFARRWGVLTALFARWEPGWGMGGWGLALAALRNRLIRYSVSWYNFRQDGRFLLQVD